MRLTIAAFCHLYYSGNTEVIAPFWILIDIKNSKKSEQMIQKDSKPQKVRISIIDYTYGFPSKTWSEP